MFGVKYKMELSNNIEKVIKRYDSGENIEFVVFFSHRPNKKGTVSRNCLSNFYIAPFTIDGITFICNEQWMMYNKAMLFGDKETANKIMKSTDQVEIKHLGREVKNFDPNIWEQHKVDIVYKGAFAKFSQNEKLRDYLLATGDSILAEGSPMDRVWGIGLRHSTNPHEWRGTNLLGFILMEVRENLINN